MSKCFIYSINYLAKNVHIDYVDVIEKATLNNDLYDSVNCIILASAELTYVTEEHGLSFYEEMTSDKYSRRRRLGLNYKTFGLEQQLVDPKVVAYETHMTTDRNFLDNLTVLKSRLDTFKLQNFIDKCIIMEL